MARLGGALGAAIHRLSDFRQRPAGGLMAWPDCGDVPCSHSIVAAGNDSGQIRCNQFRPPGREAPASPCWRHLDGMKIRHWTPRRMAQERERIVLCQRRLPGIVIPIDTETGAYQSQHGGPAGTIPFLPPCCHCQ